jgi:predicted GH43/DUF377 family glycosyl hydrolase
MILDGSDPLKILARADRPLLRSELAFETVGSKEYPTQTPWVIFTDGIQPVGQDEFIVYYGGGDTSVGAAKIRVTPPSKPTGTPFHTRPAP